jgi:hypothetical protein
LTCPVNSPYPLRPHALCRPFGWPTPTLPALPGISSEHMARFEVKLVEVVRQEVALTQKMSQMILFQQMGPVSSSSNAEKADYRKNAISFYYPDLDVKAKPKLRCMLTGEEFNNDEVIAAHIYQRGWNRAFRVGRTTSCHGRRRAEMCSSAASLLPVCLPACLFLRYRCEWHMRPMPDPVPLPQVLHPASSAILCSLISHLHWHSAKSLVSYHVQA